MRWQHRACTQAFRGHSDFHSRERRGDLRASAQPAALKLFDKLGWWNEIVETISSENQIKLERVYVRMPRHQEPKKDVAKLRKASGRRKQS